MRPGAVVFDCDGVLVDSEPHSVIAWLDVLSALNHPARADDIERCTGLGFEATHAVLSELGDLPEPEDVWPRLLGALEASFRSGLAVFSDAAAAVTAVRLAGIPTAVVSSSPRQRLDLTLESAGFSFAVSVAGDEVVAPKPDPSGYLEAIRRLGSPPDPIRVVEDTPTGVEAAVVAGCEVVAVAREAHHAEALERAGAVVVTELTPADLGLG
jgi:beta-phosphoglucomutase-like phosphatase (HAD superfamily)